jgi:hypothetical protein
METTENTQIEAVSEGLMDQGHQARSSYVTSNKNPSKKRPQFLSTENPRKSSENHQKGKTGGTQTSLEEPRRIIYTHQNGSYKVYLPPDHPSLSQDLTMKISS